MLWLLDVGIALSLLGVFGGFCVLFYKAAPSKSGERDRESSI